MKLYTNVKALCDSKKITIYALEKACGFAKGTICKWDNATPGIDKVYLVSQYFGVSIENIINPENNVDYMVTLTDMEKLIIDTYRKSDTINQAKLISYFINLK